MGMMIDDAAVEVHAPVVLRGIDELAHLLRVRNSEAANDQRRGVLHVAEVYLAKIFSNAGALSPSGWGVVAVFVLFTGLAFDVTSEGLLFGTLRIHQFADGLHAFLGAGAGYLDPRFQSPFQPIGVEQFIEALPVGLSPAEQTAVSRLE